MLDYACCVSLLLEEQVLHVHFQSIHCSLAYAQVPFVASSNFLLSANLHYAQQTVPDDGTPDFSKHVQPEGIGHHRLPEEE